MTHLKRYSMPSYWGMARKERTFAVVPRGAHPREASIPLLVALRNILGLAETSREARAILRHGNLLVNKKARTDGNFGIGLMDILEIPALGKAWRVELVRNGLALREAKTADRKLCRVIGKTTVRGGRTQLNLHDGRNILADRSGVRTGDSLLISVPEQKILEHFPLQKGADALIVAGNKRGMRGRVQAIKERTQMLEAATATLDVGGRPVETLKEHVFVIGGSGEASPRARKTLEEHAGAEPARRSKRRKEDA